jgi:hypothetical protein
MVTKSVRKRIGAFLFLLLSTTLNAQTNETDEWRFRFEETLEEQAKKERIPEATLEKVRRILMRVRLEGNPEEAAMRVASFAVYLDADLRRGISPLSIEKQYRQAAHLVIRKAEAKSTEERITALQALRDELNIRNKDHGKGRVDWPVANRKTKKPNTRSDKGTGVR